MAHGQRLHPGLRPVIAALIAAALIAGLVPDEALAGKQMPQRHFTSQESQRRPEQYRRSGAHTRSDLRLRVSRDSVSSLADSSFWNRKPYQFASPLVDGNRLYVGVDAGVFYAFELPKGRELWTFETDGPVHGKPAVADGTVFVADSEARVYALDAATGEKRWVQILDVDILATPLPSAGRVYVATMSGRLYALDTASGGELWHTEADDQPFGFSVRRSSSPIEYNGLIFFGTSSGAIRAVRASDGGIAWSQQLSSRHGQVTDVDSTPVVYNGRLFASAADGTLTCLDPSSGKILWTVDAGGVNDLAERNGRLYASGGGSLYAVDPDQGLVRWQQDLEVPEISSPAVADRYIAVTTTREKIYLIESEQGDIAYERFVGKGSYGDPVIVDDKVYLLANTGQLYSFKVRELPPKEKKEKKVRKGKKAKESAGE